MKAILLLSVFCIAMGSSSRSQNVYPATGNVGLGTSSPQKQLDVAGDTRISGGLLLQQPGTRGLLRLQPVSGTGTTRLIDFIENADIGNSPYGSIGIINESWGAPSPSFGFMSSKNGTASTKDIMFWAHDVPSTTNTAMVIKANTGYVGIGTTTPQGRLAVNGDIYGKKVTVIQSGWPDYVFSKDYKLATLEEVAAFIKDQKHLPGVPSAADIDKNGLDLGANQANLLKKIEELTLYLIEQDKMLKEQQATIKALTGKTGALEQKLKKLEKISDQ